MDKVDVHAERFRLMHCLTEVAAAAFQAWFFPLLSCWREQTLISERRNQSSSTDIELKSSRFIVLTLLGFTIITDHRFELAG